MALKFETNQQSASAESQSSFESQKFFNAIKNSITELANLKQNKDKDKQKEYNIKKLAVLKSLQGPELKNLTQEEQDELKKMRKDIMRDSYENSSNLELISETKTLPDEEIEYFPDEDERKEALETKGIIIKNLLSEKAMYDPGDREERETKQFQALEVLKDLINQGQKIEDLEFLTETTNPDINNNNLLLEVTKDRIRNIKKGIKEGQEFAIDPQQELEKLEQIKNSLQENSISIDFDNTVKQINIFEKQESSMSRKNRQQIIENLLQSISDVFNKSAKWKDKITNKNLLKNIEILKTAQEKLNEERTKILHQEILNK